MINVMRGRHLVRDNTMLIRVHLICHEFLEKNFWNLYVFSAVMTLLSHVGSLEMYRGRLVMDRGRLESRNSDIAHLRLVVLAVLWHLVLAVLRHLVLAVLRHLVLAILRHLVLAILRHLVLDLLMLHLKVTWLFVSWLDKVRLRCDIVGLFNNVLDMRLCSVERLLHVATVATGNVVSVVTGFVSVFSGHFSRSKCGTNE